MQSIHRAIATAGLALCAAAAAAPAALAQWAPDKTVKLVVPFAPGGAADTLARLVANQISQAKGQQIIVENRPGGGTILATEAVARAAPDGTSLLLTANSFVIMPSLRTGLAFHPISSFEPVCYLVYAPTMIVVQRTSPYNTLKDLIDAARAKPGTISMATVGPASSPHVAVEMLKRAAKVEIVYVPFPGGTPAVTNVVGGHVTSALANFIEVQPHLDTALRPLAVGAVKRVESHPDVPTLAEIGYPEIEATTWFGFVAPAKTERAQIDAIATALKAAIEAPDVKPKLAAVGLVPVGMCGAEYGKHLAQQLEMYAKAIRDSNIKAN